MAGEQVSAEKLRAMKEHKPTLEEAVLAGEIMQTYATFGWGSAYRLAKRLILLGYKKEP